MANNYVNGFVTDNNSEYDLVINGGVAGQYNKSALVLGNTSTYGRMMYDEVAKSSFIDVKGAADAKIVHRKFDVASNSFKNILSMVNDNQGVSSVAGDFDGRVQATQFVVQGNDSRVPEANKLNVSSNGGRGNFNVNKGQSGLGGFVFRTYDNNNNLQTTNMVLNESGAVQMEYYKKTADLNDFEAVAIAGLDANGTLVRNYEANERLRNNENRLKVVENHLVGNGTLPNKVNDIINRLNGLNFFSSNIAPLPIEGLSALPFGYIVNAPVWVDGFPVIAEGKLKLNWTAPVPTQAAPGAASAYLVTINTASPAGVFISWAGMAAAGYPAVPSQQLSVKNTIVLQYGLAELGITCASGVTLNITISSLNQDVTTSNSNQLNTGISNISVSKAIATTTSLSSGGGSL